MSAEAESTGSLTPAPALQPTTPQPAVPGATAARASQLALSLTNVVKKYPGDVQALRGVTVEIADREQVAVIGPSGSGKTTLLTIMGTLERPTSGSVKVAGQEVGEASDRELAALRAYGIGFVFQAFHLQESMTALDNVANGMLYMGQPLKPRREHARYALERVGLSHRVDFKPKQLSGGERQRVAIARAIAKRPNLILADEPTGNLDSKSGEEVVALLHELATDGATLVLITHNPTIAATFRRRIEMGDGEVVADTHS